MTPGILALLLSASSAPAAWAEPPPALAAPTVGQAVPGVSASASSANASGAIQKAEPAGAADKSKNAAPKPTFHLVMISDDPNALSDKQRAAKKLEWERALQPVAKQESTPFFFDVNLAAPIQHLDEDRPYGVAAMKRLAELTNRRWQQVDGAQVFTPGNRTDPTDYRYFDDHVLDWLENLPADDRAALTQGKLPLSRVEPTMREAIVSWVINLNPRLATTLLQNGEEAGLELAFNPAIEWRDPTTGEIKLRPVPLTSPEVRMPPVLSSDHTTVRPVDAATPLDRSRPGPLDFGPGQVLDLGEIITRAKEAFGAYYETDFRLNNRAFFVSGSFTRSAFADILKVATAVPPVTEIRRHSGWWGGDAIASVIANAYPDLLHDPLIYEPDDRTPNAPLPVSATAHRACGRWN